MKKNKIIINQPAEAKEYAFLKTCKEGFGSYWNQVSEIVNLSGVKSVLVIGQGDNIVPFILKSQGFSVDTFDFVADMYPTYVGDVREIDAIVLKQYDCVLCCEVLEHIPFDDFLPTLKKISSISKDIVLSLPMYGYKGYFKMRFPKINTGFIISIPVNLFGKTGMANNHYWEINSPQIRKKELDYLIRTYFKVKKQYQVKDCPYHMFYVLSGHQ